MTPSVHVPVRVDVPAPGAAPAVVPRGTPGRPRGPQRNKLTKSGANAIVRSFYSTVGRDVWIRALESLPLGSPGGKLLALMHDAAFDSCSIEKLCAEAGLDIPGLVRLFTDYKVGEAIIEAASKSRDVIMGLAQDASPSDRLCRTCVGFLRVRIAHPLTGEPVEIDCFDCDATGRTRTPGDPRKLETFLKVMHAADDEKVPLIALNQQFNFGAQHSMGVARGQELLAMGRRARETSNSSASGTNPPPSSAIIDVESSAASTSSAQEGSKS